MTAKSERSAATVDRPIAGSKGQKEKLSPGFENTPQSDWVLLMNYDRKTGNLLRYDPETGQLDEGSRKILQDPTTVQRLIDNKMILPGGWLTPEAKRQCAAMQKELEAKQSAESENRKTAIDADKTTGAPDPPEALQKTDMDLLLEHDPLTRHLDLNHPAIVKDATIVKRLLDNNMIEAGGKLTPQALVRCRALLHLKQERKEQAPTAETQKPSIGKKPNAAAAKLQVEKAPEGAGENKLKIIPLKDDKAEQESSEEKAFETTHDLGTEATPQKIHKKSAKASRNKKFKLGKTTARYENRKIGEDLVTLLNPHSFEAEQFKILRTNLLFSESGKTPRSVMVTSTAAGEGKSYVAANLAVSVAQHVNWNVLLIDCDLRRPNIHRQFGIQNATGLSDYLENGTDLEQLLVKTGIENLTILPAGALPDNPSELLSSLRMAALIEEVASRYKDRLIILDSPPPKLTAEAGALARYVDGILLVVKYGSTPRDSVTELISKLGKNRILGAVINNFDASISRYHRKYYGGHYYSS
jgi:exopolysaccharide/PEP-CTERM locus tyrosine autokinase